MTSSKWHYASCIISVIDLGIIVPQYEPAYIYYKNICICCSNYSVTDSESLKRGKCACDLFSIEVSSPGKIHEDDNGICGPHGIHDSTVIF